MLSNSLYSSYFLSFRPLPDIRWRKKGGPIKWGHTTTTNYGKTLVMNYVDYEDEALYECSATNGVGQALSYSIDLKVQSKPTFTVEPLSANGAEGETVKFQCEADGIPRPKIYWYHNGVPIAEAKVNPRRTVTPNEIILDNLEKEDTGNYACNASNTLGYVFKDVFINVLGEHPIFFLKESSFMNLLISPYILI